MQVVDFMSKKKEKLRVDHLKVSSINLGGAVVDTKAIFEKIDPKYKVKKEYNGEIVDFLIIDEYSTFDMLLEVFECFAEPKECSWIKRMRTGNFKAYLHSKAREVEAAESTFLDLFAPQFCGHENLKYLIVLEEVAEDEYRVVFE